MAADRRSPSAEQYRAVLAKARSERVERRTLARDLRVPRRSCADRTCNALNLFSNFGEWCNGSTTNSDSVCLGSNPSSPARRSHPAKVPLQRPFDARNRQGSARSLRRVPEHGRWQGASAAGRLEHDPEKWTPVFAKRSCSNKKMERDNDFSEKSFRSSRKRYSPKACVGASDGRCEAPQIPGDARASRCLRYHSGFEFRGRRLPRHPSTNAQGY